MSHKKRPEYILAFFGVIGVDIPAARVDDQLNNKALVLVLLPIACLGHQNSIADYKVVHTRLLKRLAD